MEPMAAVFRKFHAIHFNPVEGFHLLMEQSVVQVQPLGKLKQMIQFLFQLVLFSKGSQR